MLAHSDVPECNRPRLSKKIYSEVHNLTIQGPSWDIDKKFGTEPIATESSG